MEFFNRVGRATRGGALVLFLTATVQGATPVWLERVAPLISPAEKKNYVALPAEERRKFEENFWSRKSIAADEYFRRLEYIDTTFGSGKTGSGANTDQGTVYLSIGPPTRVARFPSSRIFVPLEIWYYDVVPGVLNSELRLIFYQKNSIGFPRLYSPGIDTLRSLLLPEAATTHMFGPNDGTDENAMRQALRVPPAEDEVISAAANVATGVKYSGNQEILGLVTSPKTMLGRAPREEVRSRLVPARPKLEVMQSASAFGGAQIDLRLETKAARELDMEVQQGDVTVYRNELHLTFERAASVAYTQRLDLLTGSYRVIFRADGATFAYPLEVKTQGGLGEIFRADASDGSGQRHTPFQFDGKQLDLNPEGRLAVVSLAAPEKVTWRIRRGSEVLWRSVSTPAPVASVELPPAQLAPGTYMLEAVTETDSQSTELVIAREPSAVKAATAITLSNNANLAPAMRLAFVSHQRLLRGEYAEARKMLQSSLETATTDEAEIDLARVDALTGNLDAGRERLRGVLARNPNEFEALSVFAYIEAKLQDYAIAAELYRRALAVQDSPALRLALAKLPLQ